MKSFIHSFKSIEKINHLRSGKAYFDRLKELIDQSSHSIHFQVYIFDLDTTGNSILSKLIAASKRGVSIFLVVDAYASNQFTSSIVNQLTNEGIRVKLFAPYTMSNFRIGRRLHHKIVLIDEKIALIGGINIANKYAGEMQTPWLDMAVEVSGGVCKDIKELCLAIWPKKEKRKWKMAPIHLPIKETPINGKLRLLQNDWWRKRIEISGSYRNAIGHSKKNLTIVASYFLPGYRKRKLMIDAARRGVNITLILGGESDIPMVRSAVKYLYGLFLNEGIQIYEWNKSVLHAKLATSDGIWTSIGSYNLNALSDYGSLEANIEVMQESFAAETEFLIEQIIQDGCIKINKEYFNQHNHILIQAYRWLIYQSIRLSLFLLFIMMQRDRLKNN